MVSRKNSNNRKRLDYQAKKRKKQNLEGKVKKQETIIRRKQKEVPRKIDGEFKNVVKSLTPAELSKERELLEKLKGDLSMVTEELKYARFAYKKSTKSSKDLYSEQRRKFSVKKQDKRFFRMKGLLTKGMEDESKEKIREISQKLRDEKYSDDDLKRDILPILNSYNESIPFTSLSKKAIEEIKEMLKNLS